MSESVYEEDNGKCYFLSTFILQLIFQTMDPSSINEREFIILILLMPVAEHAGVTVLSH